MVNMFLQNMVQGSWSLQGNVVQVNILIHKFLHQGWDQWLFQYNNIQQNKVLLVQLIHMIYSNFLEGTLDIAQY